MPYIWVAFFGGGAVLVAYGLVRFGGYVEATRAYEMQQIVLCAVFAVAGGALVVVRWRGLVGAKAFAGAAAALVALDLFAFGFRFNPVNPRSVEYPKTPEIAALQKASDGGRMLAEGRDPLRDWMPPNTPMVYGLRDIQGSDSLVWARYLRLLQAVEPGAPGPRWARLDNPALDLMGVRAVLTTRERSAGLREVYGGKARVYERTRALPRVTIPRRVRIADDEEVVEAVRTGALRPAEEALVHWAGPARGWGNAPPLQGSASGKARIVREGANEVVVEARCDSDCLLRLADPAYPGWRVCVDGRRAEMLTCDYVFRGVLLKAGKHAVVFRYEPASFRLGLFVSLLAVCAAGAVFAGRGGARA